MKTTKKYYEANIKKLREDNSDDFLQTILFMNQGETEERENVVAIEVFNYDDDDNETIEYQVQDMAVDFNSTKQSIVELFKVHGKLIKTEEE